MRMSRLHVLDEWPDPQANLIPSRAGLGRLLYQRAMQGNRDIAPRQSLLDAPPFLENSNCALHNTGRPLTPDDSIARLAEGLQRLYGKEACRLLQQFAAENAKAGDGFSAAYWNNIALVIANAKTFKPPSTGEPAP